MRTFIARSAWAAAVAIAFGSMMIWYATQRDSALSNPPVPVVDVALLQEEAARRRAIEAEVARALASRLPPVPAQSAEGILAARDAYDPAPAKLHQPKLSQARYAEPETGRDDALLVAPVAQVTLDPERATALNVERLGSSPLIVR